MVFFQLNRLIFILYNWDKVIESGIGEVLTSFYQALYLDTSASVYVLAIPFLLLVVATLIKKQVLIKLINSYFVLIIIIISLISSSELGVYEEWQTKLNYKAISYLTQPGEVIKTAKISVIALLTLIFIIQCAVGILAYNKFVKVKFDKFNTKIVFSISFFLIISLLMGMGIRGGLQPIPINQSDAFFSKNYDINQATVNSLWNFISSVLKNKNNINKNPFEFYEQKFAEDKVKSLLKVEKDTTISFINSTHPNVVFFILESWSNDLLIADKHNKLASPNFTKMISEGLFFDNIYATGTLSDQGNGAILSGQPSTPYLSIIKQPQKYNNLNCINSSFKQMDYSSSYYFGGQLSYGNIKAYIYYNNFDRIIEGEDFDSSIPQGRLGVHDEYLYSKNLEDLKNEKEPFVSAIFNLSSHSPYDQPLQDVFSKDVEEHKFLTSVYYTDSCIAKYFEEAKKQDWYKNTLFVLIADHTHKTHIKRDYYSAEKRKIPLLFYGDVIKDEFKGKTISKLFSQIDITSTVLAQLNADKSKFYWSKNMMNPYTKEFAFFTYDEAFGWKTPNGSYTYDLELKDFKQNSFDVKNNTLEFENGKAYLQTLFQQYLDY